MVGQLAILIASLIVLSVGADALVRGASALARRTRVSPLFIGLTVVGFGTSTPELCTSLLAAARDLDDVAVGNVVGSNIFNIAVILGLTALIRPIAVAAPALRHEARIVAVVATAPLLALLSDGTLGRAFGSLMLLGLGAYLWHAYRAGRADVAADATPGAHDAAPTRSAGASAVLILIGLAALAGGSQLLVAAASELASRLGVSQLTIGLTVVAGGTSAPELFTSLAAARRGEAAVAIGNVLGSNVFNVLGILGLTALLAPQRVSPQVLALDTPMMLAASLALLGVVSIAGQLSRALGVALLVGYAAYLAVLLAWAPGWFA